ncbi:MAG: MBL fold metallo-hydrolase [Myxococcota bacterium]|nr:MBL fold metallo-hydrolase [Myxococcota bacterium]
MPDAEDELIDREIGHTTVLFGAKQGKYPHGNSLLVRGAEHSAIIDPSLAVIPRHRAGRLPAVHLVINSHCHEDHVAGNFLFPDVPWWLHEADAPGIASLDAFMEIYSYDDEAVNAAFRQALVDEFHVTPRAEGVLSYADGHVFDLGGGVEIRVIHTPGHTRGHCALHVLPDDVLYLGDIDLSSFGPYYGDAWSDLEDFERSLEKVRGIEARHYATFHHIGVVDRETFLERLSRFAAVIGQREERLIEFLAEPRSLRDVSDHRFVYRPGDPVPFAGPVERRSMAMHIDRLVRQGRVQELTAGRFQVTSDVVD